MSEPSRDGGAASDEDAAPAIGLPTLEHRAALQHVLARMRGAAASEVPSFDRYEYVRRLGIGGMGIVYLVRDPELDRLVALKLLHPKLANSEGAEAVAQRMRSEARAMARVDHPNVVGVLEVGEHEGRTYIVMEYVEGTTLSHWLSARPELGWREVLRVFLAAGEGLAAAHAAGLAHCDFKPDNVLMGSKGSVRVTDFGLVRAYEGVTAQQQETLVDGLPPLDTQARDTAPATYVAGTPAFMAPEQFDGQPGSPVTDQFSFCVALHRALFGVLPFTGETLDELRRSMHAGVSLTPAERRRVPSELVRVLARGLALDPSARWLSLDELLAALRRVLDAPRRRRRRGALALALLAGLGLGGAQLLERYALIQREAACEAEGQRIGDVWSDERREALRNTLRDPGDPRSEELRARVLGHLDARARDWARVRTQACLDAQVRERWDADTLARSRRCLDGQRYGLEAMIEQLERPQVLTNPATLRALGSFPSLEPCRDELRLRSMPAAPDAREPVAQLERQLWRMRALQLTGYYGEALELGARTQAAADALGWAPLSAEVRYALGEQWNHLGDLRQAAQLVERAYFEAAAASDDMLALRAAVLLVHLTGEQREVALRWAEHARVLFTTLDIPEHDPLRLPLAHHVALVHLQHHDAEAAREQLTRVLAELERGLGPAHPDIGRALLDLGDACLQLQAYDEAELHFTRALELFGALGQHPPPITNSARIGLARAHSGQGKHEQARRELEQVLAHEGSADKPDTPRRLSVLEALAETFERMGALEQAEQMRARIEDIHRRFPHGHRKPPAPGAHGPLPPELGGPPPGGPPPGAPPPGGPPPMR